MEDYFKSSIAYYFQYLLENGYNDPIKVIVTDFLDTVKMTDDQREYVKNNAKIEENTIDNIITLLKMMKSTGKVDNDAINLIEAELKKFI